MPLAPDAGRPILAPGEAPQPQRPDRLDLVIRATTPAALETSLLSVLAQNRLALGLVRVEVLVGAGDPQPFRAVLDQLASGRSELVQCSTYSPAGPGLLVDGSGSAYTLLVADRVVLHDHRTIETLLALAASAETITAGCVLLHEAQARRGSLIAFESGGYFPSHISLLAAPRLILSRPDTRGAFPAATYPVVANDDTFMILDNDRVRRLAAAAPLACGGALAFALAALAAGHRHLCTSAVRATANGGGGRSDRPEPMGIDGFDTWRWQDVLAGVAVLRELY
jgi:hypothetical protein